MKKSFAITLLLLSLVTLSVVDVQPIKAQYQGNIVINADGSISPSTAPIKRTGDTYMLTGDIVGSISVMRSNMTFDGNGYSIIGLSLGHGPGGLSVGCNYYSSPPMLTGASNVTVKNLIIKDSVFGILLSNASSTVVVNNTISGTGNGYLSMDQETAGIYVSGGNSNTIMGNTLSNNYNGMLFVRTTSNLIVANSVANCSNPYGFSAFGILFWEASNNTIYHNNFINNTGQAYSGITIYAAGVAPLANNNWDNGYAGNYWSDYQSKYHNATEVYTSGIGDTPYVIDAENKDRYPLLIPFSSSKPKISVLSPATQTYNETNVNLVFTIDKSQNWVGYSLDEKENVTIASNLTITGLSNGFHTLVIYANDTFGNMGASEAISFTVAVPESFPVVPVVAAFSAVAVVAGAGLLIYLKKRKMKKDT